MHRWWFPSHAKHVKWLNPPGEQQSSFFSVKMYTYHTPARTPGPAFQGERHSSPTKTAVLEGSEQLHSSQLKPRSNSLEGWLKKQGTSCHRTLLCREKWTIDGSQGCTRGKRANLKKNCRLYGSIQKMSQNNKTMSREQMNSVWASQGWAMGPSELGLEPRKLDSL